MSNVGLTRFVDAWNHHCVPKKGKPIDLARSNDKTMKITGLMTTEEAAKHYVNITGGQLTVWSEFGKNILKEKPHLRKMREVEINKKCSYDDIFFQLQQGRNENFIYCIELFLRVSNALTLL